MEKSWGVQPSATSRRSTLSDNVGVSRLFAVVTNKRMPPLGSEVAFNLLLASVYPGLESFPSLPFGRVVSAESSLVRRGR